MLALIFDFDGLILDTETPELLVWNEVFASYGLSMPEGYYTSVIGRGAEQEVERPPQLLARLTGNAYVEAEARETRRRRTLELIELESPRPGIEALLKEARSSGIKIGLASSSKHAWVDLHLGRIGLDSYFETICCADDVERAKPFPDLYLLACANLGVAPKDALALEDSPNGTSAAVAAGVCVVAVPNDATKDLPLDHANRILPTLEGVSVADLKEIWAASRARVG